LAGVCGGLGLKVWVACVGNQLPTLHGSVCSQLLT
jgi:hypothetical protein